MNFILSNLFFCPQGNPIIGLEGVSTSQVAFKLAGGHPGFGSTDDPEISNENGCGVTNVSNPTLIGGIPTVFYSNIETTITRGGTTQAQGTTNYISNIIEDDETIRIDLEIQGGLSFGDGPISTGPICNALSQQAVTALRDNGLGNTIGGYTNIFTDPTEVFSYPTEIFPYPSFGSSYNNLTNKSISQGQEGFGYFGQEVSSNFKNLNISALSRVNYQKTQYRIKHYPTLTNYLKVWVRKVKNLYTLTDGTWELTQENVMENLTPYVWQDNSAPILSPTEEDIIISPVVEVLPNLGEQGYLQIYKWSYLSSYEPGVGDPNGFPPTC